MKANITLEIGREDLEFELRNLISEIASDEIRRMVREQAQKMVEEEIKRIVSPIVDSYLETALVGREYIWHGDTRTPRRTEVDDYIKKILQNYFDEPCFVYSKHSNKLSELFEDLIHISET